MAKRFRDTLDDLSELQPGRSVRVETPHTPAETFRWQMVSITTIERLKDEINHLLPELGGTKRVKLTDLKIVDTVMLRGFRLDEVSGDLDFGSRSPFLAGKRGWSIRDVGQHVE
jgi:hypothetical protein